MTTVPFVVRWHFHHIPRILVYALRRPDLGVTTSDDRGCW